MNHASPRLHQLGGIFIRPVFRTTELLPPVLMPPLDPAALQTEKQTGGVPSPGRAVSAKVLSSLWFTWLYSRHQLLQRYRLCRLARYKSSGKMVWWWALSGGHREGRVERWWPWL